jgi:hypothetical protein
MSESIDPWGDSYTEQVNEQTLREVSIINKLYKLFPTYAFANTIA